MAQSNRLHREGIAGRKVDRERKSISFFVGECQQCTRISPISLGSSNTAPRALKLCRPVDSIFSPKRLILKLDGQMSPAIVGDAGMHARFRRRSSTPHRMTLRVVHECIARLGHVHMPDGHCLHPAGMGLGELRDPDLGQSSRTDQTANSLLEE
ncbi:unnamed protein product [Protopolystoma xenopodis]|uniref:Uncharacterized protein n=1 Tax=Protopolystoma xenopodis TaxID=117903 RepID=A0A448WSN7_9PLAT|nr:unnamed protein product [Protopolystoma xenopodis]